MQEITKAKAWEIREDVLIINGTTMLISNLDSFKFSKSMDVTFIYYFCLSLTIILAILLIGGVIPFNFTNCIFILFPYILGALIRNYNHKLTIMINGKKHKFSFTGGWSKLFLDELKRELTKLMNKKG